MPIDLKLIKLQALKNKLLRLVTHLPKLILITISLLGITGYLGMENFSNHRKFTNLTSAYQILEQNYQQSNLTIGQLTANLNQLESRDERQINLELESEIKNIQDTYQQAVTIYEDLVKLKEQTSKTKTLDDKFTQILTLLSKRNYSTASAELKTLASDIAKTQAEIATTFQIPANVTDSNTAPGSGFSRQKVSTPVGEYLVDLIAADLSSTKVIVDTASESSCGNDCPVLSLADYVSRNGAYAGINGSYFCPATYPSCAGKTNSFDLLVMNKNKTYFNSDNNVYSTNPAVIFGSGWIRFVSQTLEWGRDTSIDGVLSNYPLLISGGNNIFGGDSDPKKGAKAGRSFVANKGNIVYIGVVHSASVAEAAHALSVLGMENALNLDSGGSTTLWFGGYKVGPGRNIPNAILFVKK